MAPTEQQVLAGQAVYTKPMLAAYDLLVLGVSNRFIWGCPTQRLLDHYNRHVTANHLDAGVGTGYFLDKCRFPSPAPRIALLDLNQNTLDFASRRIARYKPETYRRNVLEPLRTNAAKPRKTKGKFSANHASKEKPVAVDFSISKTLRPRTQKN